MSNNFAMTDGELRFMALMWACMDGDPKVNVEKLATLTGYTVSSTKTYVWKYPKKLRDAVKAAENGDAPETAKKTAPAASKRKASGATGTKRGTNRAKTIVEEEPEDVVVKTENGNADPEEESI